MYQDFRINLHYSECFACCFLGFLKNTEEKKKKRNSTIKIKSILCLCNSCCGGVAERDCKDMSARLIAQATNNFHLPWWKLLRSLLLLQGTVSLPHSESTSKAMSVKLFTFSSCLTVRTEKSSETSRRGGSPASCNLRNTRIPAPTMTHCSNSQPWGTRCNLTWKDVIGKSGKKPDTWLTSAWSGWKSFPKQRGRRHSASSKSEDTREHYPLSRASTIWPVLTLLKYQSH